VSEAEKNAEIARQTAEQQVAMVKQHAEATVNAQQSQIYHEAEEAVLIERNKTIAAQATTQQWQDQAAQQQKQIQAMEKQIADVSGTFSKYQEEANAAKEMIQKQEELLKEARRVNAEAREASRGPTAKEGSGGCLRPPAASNPSGVGTDAEMKLNGAENEFVGADPGTPGVSGIPSEGDFVSSGDQRAGAVFVKVCTEREDQRSQPRAQQSQVRPQTGPFFGAGPGYMGRGRYSPGGQ
jgi:hypothetical protein